MSSSAAIYLQAINAVLALLLGCVWSRDKLRDALLKLALFILAALNALHLAEIAGFVMRVAP